jgi:hypothetical protein
MTVSEASLRPWSAAAKRVIFLAGIEDQNNARWPHLCDADNAAPPRLTAKAPRDRIPIKRENTSFDSLHTVSF